MINWDDVVSRYKSASDLGGTKTLRDTYLTYGIAEIESRLSPGFSIPFSSNNVTAKDLMIDASFAKMNLFKDDKKAEKINKVLDTRIDEILNGRRGMITTSGDVLISTGVGVAFSTTQNNPPVFNMNDPEDQWVDHDQLTDEYEAK